ncbi:uncharacterized protein B0H64DRAFT_332524 [Chaetomium fimeti]|uniref:Transcription factor domain-containing protein n=1 Tax=Chaetomium fimeti TaxID=1854472 RepID=A0AAE0H5C8_9PEZI|nr:hypothetical protein B0H64DRAFT_332524 [Chaetomium fimeti]
MTGDTARESPSFGNRFSGSLDDPEVFDTTSPPNRQPTVCFAVSTDAWAVSPNQRSPLSQSRGVFLRGGDHIDEVLLSKYRAELMPQHPFVVIPEHVSATVLNNHRPVLMMCIRVIASFDSLQTMHARMQGVTRHIVDKLVRQSERTLDLLMGIVVILGWHHYHCAKHSHMNTLLCLAESLVSDLGLNKKLSESDEVGDEWGIEGQRLLLGVWYLRSSAVMHLQQLTPIPFTLHLRQCLANIQNAKEHDLDEALVYYVKIQYLAERVTALKDPRPGRANRGNGGVGLEGFEHDKGIQEREAVMAGCQAYLDKLRREVPGSLKDDGTVAMQLNTIDVRIFESRLGGNGGIQTEHTALERWSQAWISGLPIGRYRTLPSHAVFQLLYAVRVLIRSQGDAQRYVGGSSLASKFSTFASCSAPPSPGAFRAVRESGPNPFEDEMAVMNGLVAMDASPSDIAKFWVALGEANEDKSTQGPQVPRHSSLPSNLWGPGDDGFDEMIIDGTQGTRPAAIDTFSTLQVQGAQRIHTSNMFIPSSRGDLAPLGQREYTSGALLPPLPMATTPGTSHMLPTNPIPWTGEETWNHRAPIWGPSGAALSIRDVNHADVVQQRWNEDQSNPPYSWEDRI